MIKNKKLKFWHLYLLIYKTGFTLIELIMGIIIGIIIILIVGYSLIFSNTTYKNQIFEYNLEREGSFAIFLIEKKLRDKSPNDIEIQNNGEKIVINQDLNITYIEKNEKNLVYFDGKKENILLKGILEEINFEKEKENLIKIRIILSQDKFLKTIETKIKLRNQ